MVRAAALAVVLGAVAALLAPVPADAAEPGGAIVYEHPVDAEIVDRFRPPLTPFGPGNRGLKYATEPGDEIRAASGGIVTFAGQVGGTLHVTVGHPDGRLSSYSGVGEILVVPGQQVAGGQPVARARAITHVGVREHGEYIDPEPLFDGGSITVRLIPEFPLAPTGFVTPGQEAMALYLVALELDGRQGLVSRVGGALLGAGGWVLGAGGNVVGGLWWAGSATVELIVAAAPYVLDVLWYLAPYALGMVNPWLSGVVFGIVVPLLQGEVPPILLFGLDLVATPWRTFEAMYDWWQLSQNCTPEGEAVARPEGRRVAVLVGGFDSTSDGAAIGSLRSDDLGYDDADVIGFSYAGGRTPGRFGDDADPVAADLSGIDVNVYGRSDSSAGLLERSALLADLLTEVAESAPDATVDLYAHSQGGIVTRLALAELQSRPGGQEVIDQLGLVATVATPHGGADLAAIAVEASAHLEVSVALRNEQTLTGSTLHPPGSNIPDLARGSTTMNDLAATPLPHGPNYLSVGASGDMVVLDRRTHLDDARQVTVPVAGFGAHSDVVDHDTTTRELELALAGADPACRGFLDFMGDHLVSEMLLTGTAAVGLAVSFSALPVSPGDLGKDLAEELVRW